MICQNLNSIVKRRMSDNYFLDSSVILYALDSDQTKKRISLELLKNRGFVSAQVIFECFNVALKKFRLPKQDCLEFAKFLIKYSSIIPETHDLIITSLVIFEKYQLQVFDSKIVAAGLHAETDVLYSEDMQHQLRIEEKLTIVNPFLQSV